MKSKNIGLMLFFLMFLVAGCNLQSAEEAQVEFCQALAAYADPCRRCRGLMPIRPWMNCRRLVITCLKPGWPLEKRPVIYAKHRSAMPKRPGRTSRMPSTTFLAMPPWAKQLPPFADRLSFWRLKLSK